MGLADTAILLDEITELAAKDRGAAMNRVFSFWLDQLMPLRYRQVDIKKLVPSDKNRLPAATQEWFYKEVREHLDDGFLICGPVGTGKTTVAMGYFRYWLSRDIQRINAENPEYERAFAKRVLDGSNLSVWKQEAKTLLMQHHDWAIDRPRVTSQGTELGGAKKPYVNADKIRAFARRGVTPRLVLEEIDKVELTKARRDTIFDIVNTLDAELGKIFINTNLTLNEFAEMYGAQFVRRLKQSCRVINLYDRMEEK